MIKKGKDFVNNRDDFRVYFHEGWLRLNRGNNDWSHFRIRFEKIGDIYQAVETYSVFGHSNSGIPSDDSEYLMIVSVIYAYIFDDWKPFNILRAMKDPDFGINYNSVHGINHWLNVYRFGKILAVSNAADWTVVSWFAFLHDVKRENDHIDIDHGKRSVELLERIYENDKGILNEKQYEQLRDALYWHNSDNAKSDDVTIQTCWDADRLDLWRVGLIPDPDRMFTDYGKSEYMINFARQFSK